MIYVHAHNICTTDYQCKGGCRDKLYIYTDNRRGYVTARYILDRHFTPGVEYIDPSGTIRI